jgi:hypothetical protein
MASITVLAWRIRDARGFEIPADSCWGLQELFVSAPLPREDINLGGMGFWNLGLGA